MHKILLPRYMIGDDFTTLLQSRSADPLYLQGIFHPSTGYINIAGHSEVYDVQNSVAELVPANRYQHQPNLSTILYHDLPLGTSRLHLHIAGKPVECRTEFYDLSDTIFSRNSGLLETKDLLATKIVVSGCGSVGSLVALEMARAGVGQFSLIDHDVLEYHNICRHQCGIRDVGRYKVDALADCIRNINPNAQIQVFRQIIEDLTEIEATSCFNNAAAAVGCADNREADIYLDRLCGIFDSAFVSIGLWESAAAGEVFFSNPDNQEHKRYSKVFTRNDQGVSERMSKNRRVYTFEEDAREQEFQPGLSVDITFVTALANKVILDLLQRKQPGFRPKVINDLQQFTLICNFIKKDEEENSIFTFPLQITRSVIL